MVVNSLKEIPYYKTIGIIINIKTKYLTSIALFSALRWLEIPMILIDKGSEDGSFEYFSELSDKYNFYVLKLPLKKGDKIIKHGETLNYIFENIQAEQVYTIDSDTEILNADMKNFIEEWIDKENVFGAGYIHGPQWMTEESLLWGFKYGYYAERMWTAFCCLKVSKIREAFKAGYSFLNRNVFNDFSRSQLISKALILRFKIPFLNSTKLSILNPFKRRYYGEKPSYIVFDSGSDIYNYLKYKKEYDYVGIPFKYHESTILHYHGVSRLLLNPKERNATPMANDEVIRQKLRAEYKVAI